MSFDINWEEATSGPDGEELAERIRSFIHDKFQQISLPRFIRSVQVTSFNLGKVPPELEIKDLSDPFTDFYEAESDNDDDDDDDSGEGRVTSDTEDRGSLTSRHRRHAEYPLRENDSLQSEHRWSIEPSSSLRDGQLDGTLHLHPLLTHRASGQQTTAATANATAPATAAISPPTRLGSPMGDQFNAYRFFPRTGTSGILGGASGSMRYYHYPALGGLPGTSTPLAAVARGGAGGARYSHREVGNITEADASIDYDKETLAYGDADKSISRYLSEAEEYAQRTTDMNQRPEQNDQSARSYRQDGGSPSTMGNIAEPPFGASSSSPSSSPPPHLHLHLFPSQHEDDLPPASYANGSSDTSSPHRRMRERKAEDFQVFCHVKYAGDIQLSITAEILIDYPMPSFVGLPLKLNITGMAFDGIAVIAYIRKKIHLCFLSPEDADAYLGPKPENSSDTIETAETAATAATAAATSTLVGQREDRQPFRYSSRRGAEQSLLRHIQVESEIGRQGDGEENI
ncbi:Mitochondrial distribution and morphology protein 12 [Ascosphaera aggregata]|nr:Mitochondrial distribution and morphology protein 12 [Ascosphaera aggregata]